MLYPSDEWTPTRVVYDMYPASYTIWVRHLPGVVGCGLGYKHQWIVCDALEMHIHGGFGSGVITWLGQAAMLI